MPVSEKSIIDAGQVDAKLPLKKTTVLWAIGLVMGLAIVGYYGPKMATSSKVEEKEVNQTTRQNGTSKQIEAELTEASRLSLRQKVEQDIVEAQKKESLKQPDPQPVVMQQKQVDPTANTPELEMESAARISKSVTTDSSGGGIVGAVTNAGGADELRAMAQDARNSASQRDPQSALADRSSGSVDRITQLLKAQTVKGPSNNPDRDWLREYAELKPTAVIQPKQVRSRYTLVQGKVIPSVLGKALNSDLPGDITAFTTVDIYDSLTSRYLLIPKGSMLVGEYSNRVRAGQDRLMFAFSRIVLPNGISFDLPGNKGQDQMGASGIQGDVDNHYISRFASGFLIAFLADSLESKNTQPVTNIGASGPSTAAGQVLSEIAREDLSRSRDIAPTIRIPEGTRINIQVSADMEFPSAYRKL